LPFQFRVGVGFCISVSIISVLCIHVSMLVAGERDGGVEVAWMQGSARTVVV
jgi:hypothetical protein